jgi:hypothetical protein
MSLRPVTNSVFYGVILLGLLAVVLWVNFGPIRNGIKSERQSPTMQAVHVIGLAMYSYAQDHDGNYPPGKSSTEVFQNLVDSGYIVEPDIFYFLLPGKSAATSNQKLKPENVCWDFTAGATSHSPGVLPLIFTTGFRVTYTPGTAAVPLIRPYPGYVPPARTWIQWWNGEPVPRGEPGIAAFYINNSSRYNSLSTTANDGSISNFISSDFVSVGETYRQLAPDGALP